MFRRYVLRTTDAVAARAFYAEALGLALPDGTSEGSLLESWPLHERAVARGAPPHWLGLIGVVNVTAALERLLAAGSEPLGPVVQAKDGASFATVRDPFGAVVGVRQEATAANDSPPPLAWHQLHTTDVERAFTLYHELFGWTHEHTLDVAEPASGFRLFAWNAGAVVGAMGNTARLPGIHPHWLFHFPVRDVDATAARVRALGGTAMPPVTLPGGMRLVACEDPQGAAFGLASSP